MFDPFLSRYWGADNLDEATENFLTLLFELADQIDGIKVSLLDKGREIALREKLPPGMKLFTGDDFSYPELIAGNDTHFSHALLGIFDGIAPAASAAFGELDRGNHDQFLEILKPTVPLAHHIFQEPTYYYKTGLVFLAYLNGLQVHFRMIGGLESARSVLHLSRLFVLADHAGYCRTRSWRLSGCEFSEASRSRLAFPVHETRRSAQYQSLLGPATNT